MREFKQGRVHYIDNQITLGKVQWRMSFRRYALGSKSLEEHIGEPLKDHHLDGKTQG